LFDRQLHVCEQGMNLVDVIAGQARFDHRGYSIERLSWSHDVVFEKLTRGACRRQNSAQPNNDVACARALTLLAKVTAAHAALATRQMGLTFGAPVRQKPAQPCRRIAIA